MSRELVHAIDELRRWAAGEIDTPADVHVPHYQLGYGRSAARHLLDLLDRGEGHMTDSDSGFSTGNEGPGAAVGRHRRRPAMSGARLFADSSGNVHLEGTITVSAGAVHVEPLGAGVASLEIGCDEPIVFHVVGTVQVLDAVLRDALGRLGGVR